MEGTLQGHLEEIGYFFFLFCQNDFFFVADLGWPNSTVSTDFNVADKLYFEPVFWEHIYDIILNEKPEGVIEVRQQPHVGIGPGWPCAGFQAFNRLCRA